jgi:hypothetical protein
MSKHKGHKRHENNSSPNINNLSELLNNTDINQLSAMLASLVNNQQRPQGAPEQPPPNPMMGMGGSRDLMLLNALRPFLGTQKAELLDRFIEMYSQSEMKNQQGK